MADGGVFEVCTKVERVCKPNKCSFHLVCSCIRNVPKADMRDVILSEIDVMRDDIKTCGIRGLTLNIDNLHVETLEGNKESSEAGFFIAVTIVDFESMTAESLAKLITILNNVDLGVRSSSYSLCLESMGDVRKSLRRELAAKCREEANDIVQGLGYSVTGISSVKYKFTKGTTLIEYKSCEAGGKPGSNFLNKGYADALVNNAKDDVTAQSLLERMVQSILNARFTLSDSIEVKFLVG